MTWRLAESLKTLRVQLNDAYPKRRKSSDGTIGDEAHASRSSDHNAHIRDNGVGVVSAIDFTHDPANGVHSHKLAQAIIDSRDPRVKYVISNGQICSGNPGPSPWKWRKYTGSNKHTKHMHLSVLSDKLHYDDTEKWDMKFPTVKAKVDPEDKPLIKSKITQAGTVAGTIITGDVVDTAIDATRKVSDAKEAVGGTGILDYIQNMPPRFWIGILVVILIAGIVYWRWRDHGGGKNK